MAGKPEKRKKKTDRVPVLRKRPKKTGTRTDAGLDSPAPSAVAASAATRRISIELKSTRAAKAATVNTNTTGSANTTGTTNTSSHADREALERLFTGLCLQFSVTGSQPLLQQLLAIYDRHIGQMDHVTEQSLNIYARAFFHRRFKSLAPAKMLLDGFNKAVFSRALKGLAVWEAAEREASADASPDTADGQYCVPGDIICNLYSIVNNPRSV